MPDILSVLRAAAAVLLVGTENVAGVVGVAQLTGQVVQEGTGPFLALIAILSANLALMNLLPIPVLDGGALLFCAAELVLCRPLPARAQAFGTRAEVAVLASLFMFTTLLDFAQTGLFRWIADL
jgi:regulator of sigma E protease